ncbi:MAG: threonine synthase [Melioribacteraceae bacterium]|nr:threonine synthase [Melioribacteraceae bacterium]
MKYFSTRNKQKFFTFREAVLNGLAEDGGLFFPEFIPTFQKSFLKEIKNLSFREISFKTASLFIDNEIPQNKLKEIIESAIYFDAPIVNLSNELNVLELFHGPTLAFKDFGAQFMARIMEYFVHQTTRELIILVATSGDTGSAVANGFYGVEGIKVFILYPSGKVSTIQEKQLTTLDKNVTALEIEGTFDDCQRLVKQAFMDEDLKVKLNLSSANSINIARLIPQTFYYINSVKYFLDKKIIISVPSGNLGNITAGLIAKKMGMPIYKFIAATNSNSVFTEYLNTGIFSPRRSVLTYSNAMDVGNPSNLERIQHLYNFNVEQMRNEISSFSFSDEKTLEAINEIYHKFNYIIDPHGAVGYLALNKYFETSKINGIGIVAETAHYSKFIDVVEKAINQKIEIHEKLKEVLAKEKKSVKLDNNFDSLKNFLLTKN